MCFSIPSKVLQVEKGRALIEGGKTVRMGKDLKVTAGEYLQIIGNVAVVKLTKSEGLKIRKLIKKLNQK